MLAERLAEVPGVPGAWTAGSEELLGTTGGSRSSSLGVLAGALGRQASTLRAGDGVAEGGSERDRRRHGELHKPNREWVPSEGAETGRRHSPSGLALTLRFRL